MTPQMFSTICPTKNHSPKNDKFSIKKTIDKKCLKSGVQIKHDGKSYSIKKFDKKMFRKIFRQKLYKTIYLLFFLSKNVCRIFFIKLNFGRIYSKTSSIYILSKMF